MNNYINKQINGSKRLLNLILIALITIAPATILANDASQMHAQQAQTVNAQKQDQDNTPTAQETEQQKLLIDSFTQTYHLLGQTSKITIGLWTRLETGWKKLEPKKLKTVGAFLQLINLGLFDLQNDLYRALMQQDLGIVREAMAKLNELLYALQDATQDNFEQLKPPSNVIENLSSIEASQVPIDVLERTQEATLTLEDLRQYTDRIGKTTLSGVHEFLHTWRVKNKLKIGGFLIGTAALLLYIFGPETNPHSKMSWIKRTLVGHSPENGFVPRVGLDNKIITGMRSADWNSSWWQIIPKIHHHLIRRVVFNDIVQTDIIQSGIGPAIGGAAVMAAPYLWKPTSEFVSSWSDKIYNKIFGVAKPTENLIFEDPSSWKGFEDEMLTGVEEHIATLDMVADYFIDPKNNAMSGLIPPVGYLMAGPSGTGKTRLARALKDEVNKRLLAAGLSQRCEYYPVSCKEIVQDENYGGIDGIVSAAQSLAPCILFIDEIDLLGLQRPKPGSANTLLQEFLIALSNIKNEADLTKRIVVIAATNHPERLDTALLSDSRLGKLMTFELPDLVRRCDYFRKSMNHKMALPTDYIDIEKLARMTSGCSYANIESVMQAAQTYAGFYGELVTQELIERHVYQIVYKLYLQQTRFLTENERNHVLVYQAGRAAVHMALLPEQQVEFVTVLSHDTNVVEDKSDIVAQINSTNREYGLVQVYREDETLGSLTREQRVHELTSMVAGYIAEELEFGTTAHACNNKAKVQAFEMAQEIEAQHLDLDNLPDIIKARIFDQAQELITTCEQEARKTLEQNKETFEVIRTLLKESPLVTGEQISYVTEHSKDLLNMTQAVTA